MTISWAKLSLLRIAHMGPTYTSRLWAAERERAGGGKKKKKKKKAE
jgi:hypothetical protein